MRNFVLAAGAVIALAITSSAFAAANGPAQTGTTSLGTVLTDQKGMTLYTYDKDAAGKSNCNGPCEKNWPPLAASADAKPSGDWTVVTRDDGAKQWAYKTKPVYGWAKDTKPGDTTGDGVAANSWHVAKP